MTNPTLERAARALIDHWFNNNDHGSMVPVKQPWEDLSPKQRTYAIGQARAVLMAVLPELERYEPYEFHGSYDENQSKTGPWIKYDDLTAILAEGE